MSAKACDCGPTLAELLVDRSPENLTLQLSEVDSAIARLSERSRELRERINATNPFLSLPTEIISEISAMACQPVYNANDPDNFARSTQPTTPLMLGNICRTWRHIAWVSPRLWNVIFLGLRREPKVYKAQVEVLEEWLSRSGDLLLSIHLNEMEDDLEGWLESPPTEVFNLLASYSHRWLHLRTFLVGPCWEDLDELPLPFLTSLAVEPPGHVFGDAGYYVTPTWRISDAPFLRTVFITLFSEEIKLPTHQLTQITLQSQHWKSCLLLLAETPNVVHCALRDFMAYINETNYQAVISLPHMSSFSVGSSHARFNALMNILNCITAPALYRMQLEWTGISSSEPLATIRAFLFRSSCSLHELSLHIGVDTKQSELVALLGDTESLEILELTCEVGQGSIDPVFHHINPARPEDIPQYLPAARVLLPHLRCFRYKGPMRFKIKTLVDMIDMRYRLAYDSEKKLELGGEENHSRIARPEAFSINISQINRDQRTSLSASAGTLQRLIDKHAGITFSFLDQATDDDIPLLRCKSSTDLASNVVNQFSMFEGFRG